jgi:tetratricopeptide (TPR) repeat protein
MLPETLDLVCRQAQRALARGAYEQARQLYLKALEMNPAVASVHYGLATVCFQLNHLTAAAHHFQEVTRLDPRQAGAFINLGAVYTRLNQADQAVAVLHKGLQLDHTRPEGYYNLGMAYAQQGQLDLAIQAYREAIRANPRMPHAFYKLGNLYLEKGQPGQAIDAYQQALALRPDWDKAQQALAAAQAAIPSAAATASDVSVAVPTRTQGAPLDPERVLDPEVHGIVLEKLHRASVDADNHGRALLVAVNREVEPVIKLLAKDILNPASGGAALERSVERMEGAVAQLATIHAKLGKSLELIGVLGEKLLRI